LQGPGVPELDADARLSLEQAWEHLLNGQLDLAASQAQLSTTAPPATLLQLQIEFLQTAGSPLTGLRELTSSYPDYAAGWATLSVVAERENIEPVAYMAARETAQLWRRTTWKNRLAELTSRWIDDRVNQATLVWHDGAAQEGLDLLDKVFALEPSSHEAVVLRAQILISLDRLLDAELTLAPLGADPDALFLAGQIAEARSDWLNAMDIYAALPEEYPQRATALRRTQLQWRLSHLPEYVNQALASPRLTRGELAVLLVSLAPEVEGYAGGSIPLLTDVVALKSQNEILTAVRLNLLRADTVEHHFYPEQPTTSTEVRSAIDELCLLINKEPPNWCDPAMLEDDDCTALENPVAGRTVADLILTIIQEESPQ